MKASELFGAKRVQEKVDGEDTCRCLEGAHRTVGAGRSGGTRAAEVAGRGIGDKCDRFHPDLYTLLKNATD